jgi:hypothetical protein
METKNPEPRPAPAPMLGCLIAPIAVLLALAATQIVGMSFDLDFENLKPMLVILAAASLGLAPRVLQGLGKTSLSTSTLSFVSLVVALVGAEVAYMLDFGAVTSLLFFIVMFGVHILVMRSAFEWANVLMFAAVGVELGFVAAGSVMNNAEISSSLLMSNGETIGVLDAYRAIIGFQFFSYVMLFTILGILVAVLARGVLSPSSADGWFSHITDGNGAWNRSTLPLQIGLGVWALAHIASLWHFEYLVNDPQTMFNVFGPFSGPVVNAYPELANYHGYFGFWSAFLTGMVAMIVSAMVSERWFTRAMLLGSMWALYLVSAWYEAGLIQNEAFEGSWGALIWLAFTFFICAIIYVISTSDNWGGWSNISEYEPSGARRFWNAHWAGIMIGMAFFFGMVICV